MSLKRSGICVALFGVLASSALALPSALSFLGDTRDFLVGLFDGTASIEQASFIAFALYFVLLLALFIEGVRALPLFGNRGTVNRQGRVFAVAASALSTIAIFVVDNGSSTTIAERVPSLLAPFGIWAAVALAGLVAYMSYRFIRNMGILDDQVVIAIAIAVAIGVTMAGFLLTIDLLVGWGFVIVLLAMVVGLVRAFMLQREAGAPAREARENRRRADNEARNATDDQRRAVQRAQSQRRRLLRAARSRLAGIIQEAGNCERDLRQAIPGPASAPGGVLTPQERRAYGQARRARNGIRQILGDLQTIHGRIVAAQVGADPAQQANIGTWAVYVQTVEQSAQNLQGRFPPVPPVPTPALKNTLRAGYQQISTRAGWLMGEIDNYINSGTANPARAHAPWS